MILVCATLHDAHARGRDARASAPQSMRASRKREGLIVLFGLRAKNRGVFSILLYSGIGVLKNTKVQTNPGTVVGSFRRSAVITHHVINSSVL